MKKLFLFSGVFLLAGFVARAGVGPGVASGLSITSPLMGGGQAALGLTPSFPSVAPSPVLTPAPTYPSPAPPNINVVPPLPGASAQAPVAVTVGPTVRPDHGVRGWFHPQHWWHRGTKVTKQDPASAVSNQRLVQRH